MEVQKSGSVELLLGRGVRMPLPHTVEIGAEVDPARIAAEVTIHPGCRIRGSRTALSAGVELGQEGPVTLEDCQLGRDVKLQSGSFRQSVFLERSSMGPAAQVREACLLEEEASGAHAVGLKQTILFPWVTLGSLINFCDVLMAGGKSRRDHSEVGSSYIHFNFTPDADKATPSLVGDVPRGVTLAEERIFLGGQGGLVGPARIAYGTVIAAGTVQRGDVNEPGRLIVPRTLRGGCLPFRRGLYPGYRRILEANLAFIGSLWALETWYRSVRRPFFEREPFSRTVFEGALSVLEAARRERLARLESFLGALGENADGFRRSLRERRAAVSAALDTEPGEIAPALQDDLLAGLDTRGGYLEAIRQLDPAARAAGVGWLEAIVSGITERALQAVESP